MRQQCRDNVTMFLGHKLLVKALLPEALRPLYLYTNIFTFLKKNSCPWISITLSRCRCREDIKLLLATVWLYSILKIPLFRNFLQEQKIRLIIFLFLAKSEAQSWAVASFRVLRPGAGTATKVPGSPTLPLLNNKICFMIFNRQEPVIISHLSL